MTAAPRPWCKYILCQPEVIHEGNSLFSVVGHCLFWPKDNLYKGLFCRDLFTTHTKIWLMHCNKPTWAVSVPFCTRFFIPVCASVTLEQSSWIPRDVLFVRDLILLKLFQYWSFMTLFVWINFTNPLLLVVKRWFQMTLCKLLASVTLMFLIERRWALELRGLAFWICLQKYLIH